MQIGYVFGYGSLASKEDWLLQNLPGEMLYGCLQGYRRTWRVAFDNSVARGKYYLHPNGSRYLGAVATLGIDKGGFCNGVAIPVSEELLCMLDKREEGLYKRISLPIEAFSEPLEADFWTYYPTDEARMCYENSSPVLPEDYLQVCQQAFISWGGWELFLSTTDPLVCPLLPLELYREPGWAGI